MKEREAKFPPAVDNPTEDYRYSFRGLWAGDGLCRIRLFEGRGATPLVIATELPDNPGPSITNMAEYLAAEILERHFPSRIGLPRPMNWVEHYPERRSGREVIPEEFDLVSFQHSTPIWVPVCGHCRRSLGTPEWRFLGREGLERLIGRTLV